MAMRKRTGVSGKVGSTRDVYCLGMRDNDTQVMKIHHAYIYKCIHTYMHAYMHKHLIDLCLLADKPPF